MAIQTQSPSLPPTQSKVNPETITTAVKALLKWSKSKSKLQKSQLFEQDDFFYLILTLNKIPTKARTNPHKIPLPNPLHPFDSSQELCLIIDDRTKSLNSEIAKKKIESDNIPISKLIKFSKLKSDFRAFEDKRKLCGSYDLFFADKRVIPLLPKCLGKEFYKKKKIPIPVDLTQKNWKEQVQLGCESALLFLRSGTCSVVKVGRVSQGREEIVGNVIAAINGVAEIVPRKWGGIRSFHLKLTDSLALPIYQSVPEVGLKIEGIGKKGNEQVESGEEGVGEETKKKKLGDRKKKKGKIHDVRYMDNDGEVLDVFFSHKDDVKESSLDGEKVQLKRSSVKKKKNAISS